MTGCRLHILLLAFLLFSQGRYVAQAQAPPGSDEPWRTSTAWQLVVDGRYVPWPLSTTASLDSLHEVVQGVVRSLQSEGYVLARVDSVTIDSLTAPPAVAIYATRGPSLEVAYVDLSGVSALDSSEMLRQMTTVPGQTFDPRRLEADLEALLEEYELAGYPLAQVRIRDLKLVEGPEPAVGVLVQVDEGGRFRLDRVEVVGAERTKADYVARISGLALGQPVTGYDPGEIQRRLEATSFFKTVDPPQLLIASDSTAVVRIKVEEADPGAFDLVLGYQPAAGEGSSGQLVGNGHLVLSNLFGAGRMLSLRLNRLPNQVSSVDARFADPFVFGLPLHVEGRFSGYQQAALFGKQAYGVELGYTLMDGLQIFGTLSREATRPGQDGQQLSGTRQRIARADAWFTGLGLRYRRLDRPVNPGRGLVVEVNAERGRKERSARLISSEQDTLRERVVLRQERLQAEARLYHPVFARQVVVTGAETALLLSNEYDESDLFRVGGATSLRGYDEDRFLARFFIRFFLEHRLRLDRTSYIFAFVDLGYVERPVGPLIEPEARLYPGYGLGIHVGTDVGPIKLSFAANPEDPTAARVHLGLSLGL